MCGTFSTNGEKMDALRLLARNPEGKWRPGRARSRVDNIKMNIREIEWCGGDWIVLSLDLKKET
jgi:hypothetical protein